MLKFFIGEEFREVQFDAPRKKRYAVSNFGRVVSFTEKPEMGSLVKGSINKQGYHVVWFWVKRDNKFVCQSNQCSRMVAKYFLERTSDDQIYVLHLDHNKLNDHYKNLKWATREELTEHSKKSPYVIESKIKAKENNFPLKGHKLTATKVMYIKKLLAEPNRKTRLKILAKRFGVSEMTLHRIRTGENWGHIEI